MIKNINAKNKNSKQNQTSPTSPCIKVCTLNDKGMCIGCGRYDYEIKAWKIRLSDEEKLRIIKELPKRLESIEGKQN